MGARPDENLASVATPFDFSTRSRHASSGIGLNGLGPELALLRAWSLSLSKGQGWGAKAEVTSGFVSTCSTNFGMGRSPSLRCLEPVERWEDRESSRPSFLSHCLRPTPRRRGTPRTSIARGAPHSWWRRFRTAPRPDSSPWPNRAASRSPRRPARGGGRECRPTANRPQSRSVPACGGRSRRGGPRSRRTGATLRGSPATGR